MDIFNKAVSGVTAITNLLQDPATEQSTTASDRVGGTMTTNAAMTTQATSRTKYGFFPSDSCEDVFYSQASAKTTSANNPMKLVQLANADWFASSNELIKIFDVNLPNAFYNETYFPAHGPTRPFAAIRTSFNFELQANVVTGSVGSVIMAYVPPGVNIDARDWKTIRLLPHAELNIGIDTTAKLFVPYTQVSNYVGTDTTDLGKVIVVIWSRLSVAPGAPTTTGLILMGSMVQADLQMPRPMGPTRRRMEICEGVGVMNISCKLSTERSQSIALLGESVTVDPATSGAKHAVRSLKDILKVYSPVTLSPEQPVTENWEVSAPRGSTLFSYATRIETLTSIFKLASNGLRFWRGSVVFRLTVFNTTFQKGRLRMAFFPGSEHDYTYEQSNNALYTILDIGLNSSVELTVQYMSLNRLTTVDQIFGDLKVFVAAGLSAANNTTTTARVLIEARAGDDFLMCVPHTNKIHYQNDDDESTVAWGNDSTVVQKEADSLVTNSTVEGSSEQAASVAGMSAPGMETSAPGGPIPETPAPKLLNAIIKNVNVVGADHMSFQAILGRAQYEGYATLPHGTWTRVPIGLPTDGFYSWLKAFAYFNGDLVIHLANESDGIVEVCHTYYPQVDFSNNTASTLGELIIPKRQQVSFTVPFYYHQPAKILSAANALGDLWMKPGIDKAVVSVWISFKAISLFHPIMVPKVATLRSTLQQYADSAFELPHAEIISELILEGKADHEYSIVLTRKRKQTPKKRNQAQMLLDYLTEVPNPSESDWKEDLTEFGGVEKNPGPVCKLVYLNRGLYRHYGVKHGNKVIHMNSENVLEAAASGQVGLVITDYHEDWHEEQDINITDLRMKALTDSIGMKHLFNLQNNCETWAKEALGIDSIDQGRALAVFGCILCMASSISVMPQGEVKDFLKSCGKSGVETAQKISQSAKTAWHSVKTFFTESLLDSIQCSIVKAVFKILVRVVCYGICFCSSPTLLTGAAIGTLIAMDICSLDGLQDTVKVLCTALIDGDLMACVEAIQDITMKNSGGNAELARETCSEMRSFINGAADAEPQGDDGFMSAFKDFNVVTTSFRNLDYWLNFAMRLVEFIKKFFIKDTVQQAQDYLERKADQVQDVLVTADQLIVNSRDPGSLLRPEMQTDLKETANKLILIKYIAMSAQNRDLLINTTQLLNRITAVPRPPSADSQIIRPEPIGVWISGEPGCGKSTFTLEIVKAVKEILEQKDTDFKNTGIFTQPTGCDFMDGYRGQWCHIIDDMGQDVEEGDMKNICQMISSVPFTVNMAGLDQKGQQYTSRILLATTNHHDFTTTSMYSSGAFSRRFGYKFKVRANPNYRNEHGKLNLAKASESGALSTGHCWEVAVCKPKKEGSGLDTGAYEVCNLRRISQDIAADFMHRTKVCKTLQNQYKDLKKEDLPCASGASVEKIKDMIKPEGDDDEPACLNIFSGDLKKWVDKKWQKTKDLAECIEKFDAFTNDAVSPFESLKRKVVWKAAGIIPKAVKVWFDASMAKAKTWLEKNKWWLIGMSTLVGIITSVAGLHYLYSITRQNLWENYVAQYAYKRDQEQQELEKEEMILQTAFGTQVDPERAYSRMKVAKRPDMKKIKIVPQGPNPAELNHLSKLCVGIFVKGKTNPVHAMSLGGHRVICYDHVLRNKEYHVEGIIWQGLTYEVKEEGDYWITLPCLEVDDQEQPVDYCYIDFPKLPFQLKSPEKYLATPEHRRDGVALSVRGLTFYTQPCYDIETHSGYSVAMDYGPTIFHDACIYRTASYAGMCGSLICQKQKGTWKIVAMHHAGDRFTYGYGFKIRFPAQAEGVVIDKKPSPKIHFTPTKTKLRKSPLHAVFPCLMEPAPLTGRDPRIEDPPENLVKRQSEKYRVDHYDVDYVMDECKGWTTKQLFSTTGRQGTWTMQQALSGDDQNPIDLTTSPGKKYTDRGLTKKDLVQHQPDGTWWIDDNFASDVWRILDEAQHGKPQTTFAANLKDELRPVEKVAAGNARCIEACSFDYTVAHRMIFGPLYQKIYDSPAAATGIAAGINPYTDYHGLALQMYDQWFAVDFNKFDGSLSEGLMRDAAECLTACCEDPDLAMNLLEPVFVSTHLVHDEIWTVKGGMPSGSPCTTILNSMCNLLVMRYSMIKCGLERFEDHCVVTYGDDVLGSTKEGLDTSRMAAIIKESFGMTATSADKQTDQMSVSHNEATFLKRKFRFFPGTCHVTGVLDLDSMLGHIQWCKGSEAFKQQWESFVQELVLHGEEVYNEVTGKARPHLDRHKVYVPPYRQAWSQVYHLFFE
uniref:Genome polyprotein n=1 Tax=Wenling hoplichthys picornavirus TaxID=2116208 RepID=A0A2P1GN82_9VIRU|nr:polyprotein [Wenling hoplichthys picornavirus]